MGLLFVAGLLIAGRKSRSARVPFTYHTDYQRFVWLRDGQRVLIRPLHSFDRFRIAREMVRLSDQSRYFRFHRPKAELTREELLYLTEIDGVNHFALGAVDKHGEGLGVARFIRYPHTPQIAEVAIVVADRVQGQGLGRQFLQVLIEAAAERGIATLRAEVLSSNRAGLHLLRSIVPGVRQSWEDGVAVLDIPVVSAVEGNHGDR